MNARFTLAIAIAVFILNGAAANAADLYSKGSGGDWHTLGTFNTQADGNGADQVPTANDDVHIQSADTVTVSDFTANGAALAKTVDVADSATAILDMLDDGELWIVDSLTMNGSGLFRFYADDGETAPRLRATSSLEITGDITVVDPAGSDGGAGGVIEQDPSDGWVILKSGSTISSGDGPIDITADVQLESTGKILANSSDAAYRIRITGAILDGSSGLIEASGNSAALVQLNTGSSFNNSGASGITVDFKVDNGAVIEFNDNSDYVTGGGFSMPSGKFKMADLVTVTFEGSYTH